MVVIGAIIGAGIFLNPAIVAQRVGTATLVLVAWGIGGGVALIGAVCFGALGAHRPQAGGGYVYLREAFGPLAAFLYGWTQLLVINTGGIAAVAVTFASYATNLLALPDALTKPVAVAALVLLTGINYFGIRPGSLTQNLFTVLKLVAVAGLVLVGLSGLGTPPDTVTSDLQPPVGTWATLQALSVALIPVLFAYGGWQQANHLAAEVRDPERTLPQALLLGVLAVVAAYLLVNLACLQTLGTGGLAASTAPASEVMRRVLGPTGGTLIALGIVVSTFGFVNVTIMAGARVFQAMAADGVFFRKAATLHPQYRSPAVALLAQGAWAVVLVLSGSYGQLLDYVVFGDWIFFGLVVATLFHYRRTGDVRLPGYPVLPVLFLLVAAFAVASTVWSNPWNALLGAGLMAAGIPVFFWWNRTQR